MTRRRITSIFISSKWLLLLLLVFAVQSADAQQKRKRPVAAPDTTAFFNGVAVAVDLVGPIQKAVGDYGQYEASVRLNLKDRYFPIVEIGYGQADAEDASTRIAFRTKAPYGRLGVDFNLLKEKHEYYRVYGGVRYAFTSYKYDIDCPPVVDPVWGGESSWSAEGVKASCHWAELCAGVDVRVWGPLHLGWSVRYKQRIAHDDGTFGNTWYVPGYGRTGSHRLGGTFNIGVEF